MAALARDGASDGRIRALVTRFARLSVYALPRALDSYVRSIFAYEDEDIETLKAPERILDEIEAFGDFTGDCDDVSIWTATLAVAMGFPARFVAIRVNPEDREFSHVFTDVNFPVNPAMTPEGWGRAWIRFDATVPIGTEHEYAELMVEHV